MKCNRYFILEYYSLNENFFNIDEQIICIPPTEKLLFLHLISSILYEIFYFHEHLFICIGICNVRTFFKKVLNSLVKIHCLQNSTINKIFERKYIRFQRKIMLNDNFSFRFNNRRTMIRNNGEINCSNAKQIFYREQRVKSKFETKLNLRDEVEISFS